jgi:hypothetical protein
MEARQILIAHGRDPVGQADEMLGPFHRHSTGRDCPIRAGVAP